MGWKCFSSDTNLMSTPTQRKAPKRAVFSMRLTPDDLDHVRLITEWIGNSSDPEEVAFNKRLKRAMHLTRKKLCFKWVI